MAFVEQLEAFKSERLAPILGAGRTSLSAGAPGDARSAGRGAERGIARVDSLDAPQRASEETALSRCLPTMIARTWFALPVNEKRQYTDAPPWT